MLAFAMALALSTLHCSGSSGKTTDGTASDSIAADSKPPARTAAQQLLFAGWVDRPSQPMVLSLEVQDGNVKGTVTYAKFGKPIALKGTQTNGQFVLEERLDGKQTGEWSFAWDMSAGRSDLEGESEASGKWRKSNSDPKALPVMLHPIRPLALSDTELKRRFEGGYGDEAEGGIIVVDDSPLGDGHGFASMEMTYVGSRHFSFNMDILDARSDGCSADGYLVMVAPDTAMFWGEDNARVRFVFHADSVSSQMLHWSFTYCGAGASGFDANMKKR